MTTDIRGFTGPYRFLSNFYVHDIEYLGHQFQTNEHAYQAAKAVDDEDFLLIKNSTSPQKAKQLGQVIQKRPDWQFVNLDIMKNINRIKFTDPYLRQKLLNTGDALLVETNWWHDNFFGDCVCNNRNGRHPECLEVGENWLGKCLMQIRTEIQNATK